MASEHLTATDVCEHGNEHASCPECNPIFKDEVTMPGFHYVLVSGDQAGNVLTAIEMQLAGAR